MTKADMTQTRTSMTTQEASTEVSQLLDNLRSRYFGLRKFQELIATEEIEVLSDFLDNWNHAKQFYTRYYGDRFPRTVICGLNPGRLGAGKTGVPFLDFASLSTLLPGIVRQDTEPSAQFFFRVVQHFGADSFFRSFFVTNVSWVGFKRGAANLNYADLPPKALAFVEKMFQWEMKQVKPLRIVSLGVEVQKTVNTLFARTPVDTTVRLPHPRSCVFPKKVRLRVQDYIDVLSKYCVQAK